MGVVRVGRVVAEDGVFMIIIELTPYSLPSLDPNMYPTVPPYTSTQSHIQYQPFTHSPINP